MIIVLFGQPHSGKTTLAKALSKEMQFYKMIDGDQLRDIFQNKDYSREGRIKNLNRASDIARYLEKTEGDVILSLVYPYKEARDYLNSLSEDVIWVFLHYEGTRGREAFHVADFELDLLEEKVLSLNTSTTSINRCINKIITYTHAEDISKWE